MADKEYRVGGSACAKKKGAIMTNRTPREVEELMGRYREMESRFMALGHTTDEWVHFVFSVSSEMGTGSPVEDMINKMDELVSIREANAS